MAIITGQLTVVDATPVQLDTSSVSNFKMMLHNMSNTDNLFVGNANVTPTTGFEVHSHAYITLDCQPNDAVYVCSSNGTHSLAWMKIF